MFTLHVSPIEITVREVLLYPFFLLLVRASGKREIGGSDGKINSRTYKNL
jgi:uncharacterized membrane protein YcaP (DUF421 family)